MQQPFDIWLFIPLRDEALSNYDSMTYHYQAPIFLQEDYVFIKYVNKPISESHIKYLPCEAMSGAQ